MNTSNITIESYGHSFDVSSLPEASVRALLSRGFNHVLGNEVASKVTAWKARVAEGENPITPSDDEIAAKKAEYQADMIAKIKEGTLGIRAAGVTVDPVEAEMERLAKEYVQTTLKANNLKFVYPKDENGKRVKGSEGTVTLKDGTFTLDELVDRQLSAKGDEYRAKAKKNIDAKAKRLKEAANRGVDL